MADAYGGAAPAAAPPSPVVEPVSGRLPALPEPRAAVVQALFRRPRRWTTDDGAVLVFEPGDPPSPAEAFAIDSDGVGLALALDPRDGALPEGLHWSDHAGRSRVLAWSLAHEHQLVRLSQALGMALVPAVSGGDDPVATVTAGEGTWLRFRLGARDGAADMTGSGWFPLSRLQWLIARADPPADGPAELALAHWSRLPAPVVVRMPGPRVPQGEWAGLAPGGVIVVGRASDPPQVRAHGAGRAWPVRASAEGWRVEGPGVPDSDDQEKKMSEDEQQPNRDPAGGDPATTPVDTLPVQVQFELGRLEVALGDLAQLQPGYVFALPAHLQGANVAVRANGREVGRGELVAVGDTLGVRLLAWS